jgi:hypothetical protein
MLTVLALLALAGTDAQSTAVARLYRDACLFGELRLEPKDGRIVEWEEMPASMRGLHFMGPTVESATYIRMINPPATYIVMTKYKEPRPGRTASECIVVSGRMSLEDASAAFFQDTPEAKPRQGFANGLWYPSWTIDVPDKGYTKNLWRSEGWTWFTVTVKQPANQ